VIRRSLYPLLFALLLESCNRAPADKDAIRKGLIEHLSKNAGLDMNAVDLNITDLKFENNQAKVAVAFKPKSGPDGGMSLNYTLERRGNDWVVVGRGSGHGAGMAMPQPGPPAGDLPPGHPPAAKGEALPPGHPPVNSPPPPAK
jgi:hypothetical protein